MPLTRNDEAWLREILTTPAGTTIWVPLEAIDNPREFRAAVYANGGHIENEEEYP